MELKKLLALYQMEEYDDNNLEFTNCCCCTDCDGNGCPDCCDCGACCLLTSCLGGCR